MPNGNGSPKGNPEGLGEIIKRVLHEVQRAVAEGHYYSTQHCAAQQYTE